MRFQRVQAQKIPPLGKEFNNYKQFEPERRYFFPLAQSKLFNNLQKAFKRQFPFDAVFDMVFDEFESLTFVLPFHLETAQRQPLLNINRKPNKERLMSS